MKALIEGARKARRVYQKLPKSAQIAVWAVVIAGPVLAFSSGGSGNDEPAGDGGGSATAASSGGSGSSTAASAAPKHDGSSAVSRATAASTSNASGTFVRGIAATQSFDLNYEVQRVERARPFADPEDDLDLDDALDVLRKRVREASDGADVFKTIRQGGNGKNPTLLLANSMALMSAGDVWGAAATLIVAHEIDDDDATPLVNLAAIANSQGLPGAALAFLDAASDLDIEDDDSPMGMRELATLLNNRGHALTLLGRYEDAEKPLRQALEMSPEMSEAARNLIHVLLKQNKREEAEALAPRAVWRLNKPPQVRSSGSARPGEGEPTPTTPKGTPEELKQWSDAPYLVEHHGRVSLPLHIALDLSKQGQIAWPEPLYPKPDPSYVSYFPTASARYVAAGEAAQALMQKSLALTSTRANKRMTIGDVIQQSIEVRVGPLWMLEPIDTEQHELEAYKENLILGSNQPTRFQALDVARAEYQMELAADRFNERYRKESHCPTGATVEACCEISRAATNRNIVDFTPTVREYEERMRVFFRQAYGLGTAYASNLPPGVWHDMARIDIEHDVQRFVQHTQREIAFAFIHAAPRGSGCYGPASNPKGEAPDIDVDAPACSAASQWASGKYKFSEAFSMEVTCGKMKFVAEYSIPGIRKVNWGPLTDAGIDLGMHAEVEITMAGTVTLFAGPKGGVGGKVGGVGADFGVKDGIYAVIGRNGVQDAGFRVVIGGGIGGTVGGTHDVDQMDFSFASAI